MRQDSSPKATCGCASEVHWGSPPLHEPVAQPAEQRIERPTPKRKRLKAVLVACGICVLVAIVFFGITNALVIGISSQVITTVEVASSHDADAIIVLGAQVNPDGAPSWVLQDRLDNAIDLYERGAAPKIIMSGDHGTAEYDEVRAMKQYAIDAGVPAEDVFCDHAGFSTYETMHRAKNVFGAERIIVSTQKYHLYRALYDALGLGLEAVGVPAEGHVFAQQLIWDIREIPARSKDLVKVAIDAPPTFGGEPIDLNGSGNVTDD